MLDIYKTTFYLQFQVNVRPVHLRLVVLVTTTMEPVIIDSVETITGMRPGPDVTN